MAIIIVINHIFAYNNRDYEYQETNYLPQTTGNTG